MWLPCSDGPDLFCWLQSLSSLGPWWLRQLPVIQELSLLCKQAKKLLPKTLDVVNYLEENVNPCKEVAPELYAGPDRGKPLPRQAEIPLLASKGRALCSSWRPQWTPWCSQDPSPPSQLLLRWSVYIPFHSFSLICQTRKIVSVTVSTAVLYCHFIPGAQTRERQVELTPVWTLSNVHAWQTDSTEDRHDKSLLYRSLSS